MAIEDNQVLLKLLIKGMSPDEVRELARQTMGQLKTEASVHIDALTSYYREAQAAQDQASKDSADEKIKNETRALDAVTKLMRQQEVEANKARQAWHGIMEDLENITTVATGAFRVMEAGWGHLKSAMEEIIKDTNVYNSLTGSIEQMKIATGGLISNVDLITTKNRALEKELKLTDDDFGVVAKQAMTFAHATGVDAKDALESLVDGLATGRMKMLQHAGIMKEDLVDANEKWAKANHVAVESMTDENKLLALQEAAIDAMKTKQAEAGEAADTLAEHMERGWVRLKNAVTDAAVAIGNIKMAAGAGEVDKQGFRYARTIDENGNPIDTSEEDAAAKAAENKKANKAWAEEHGVLDDSTSVGGSQSIGIDADQKAQREKMKMGDKRGEAAAKAAAAKAAAERKKEGIAFIDDLYRKIAGSEEGSLPTNDQIIAGYDQKEFDKSMGMGTEAKDASDAQAKNNEQEEKALVTKERIKGIVIETAVAYQKLADSLGVNTANLTHEEKLQALNNEAMVQAEKLAEKAKKEAEARRAELKSTKDKAGFMGIFLWGTDGPDQTYREMDEFQQRLVDTMGSLSAGLTSQSEALANGIGKGVGAAIAGADAGTKSIRQQTHDALLAMAEQAAGKALWEGAESIASFAVGNIEGGTLHAAAAAAYGGVAVGAGLAARAVGNTPGQTQEQKWTQQYNTAQQKKAFDATLGGGMTTSGSGNQGASGSRSSTSANDNAQPIYIQNIVMPGAEADAGRSVAKSLEAYYNRDGTAVNIRTMSGP